jgi:catechol 2,3-dioxygenase-like lactoylglutathione lyase family enzyme
VITGTHAIVYAEDADRARAFFRDVLGLPNVDAGGGWLIFRMPPAELGVHPAGASEAPQATAAGRHELFLMCDDITATVDELAAKGVEFLSGVSDEGFGLMTTMRIPGGGVLGLYQARHPVAHDLGG